MRCEELEAIVFSDREVTAEEREEMEAHARTCEACRALLDHADVLSGMQHIDEDVTAPESFKVGWRSAIRHFHRRLDAAQGCARRRLCRVRGAGVCGRRGHGQAERRRYGGAGELR